MSYDPSRDESWTLGDRGNHRAGVGDPATRAVRLTAAMLSDTADLAAYAKALRVWNGSAGTVTLLITPLTGVSDLAADAVPITIPAGAATLEPISVRRIWSTGSTNLAAGLADGTVEVLLLTM